MIRRDGWEREEHRRVEEGLVEVQYWQAIEPYKADFWEMFWVGMIGVHYPEWQWRRQPRTGLAEFMGGVSVSGNTHSTGGTERTVGDEGMVIIEPSRDWASDSVDDRHSMGGAGTECREGLYLLPHSYRQWTIQSAFASPVSSENAGSGLNTVPPQDAHPFRFPIGRISPFGSLKAAYIDPQSSHAATSRVRSLPFISSELTYTTEKHAVRTTVVTRLLVTAVVTEDRSVDTRKQRRDSGGSA